MFRFKCVSCDQWHEGMPGFATMAPSYYDSMPPDERAARCYLDSDFCVIDNQYFFVRACLELPVIGTIESFVWGVWVSLSDASFKVFVNCYEEAQRSHNGPFFGWLAAELPLYPDTNGLKTHVHLRDEGVRPRIELEPTNHPLAVEQRNGLDAARVAEIFSFFEHQQDKF